MTQQEISDLLGKLSLCLTKGDHAKLKSECENTFSLFWREYLGNGVKDDISWLFKLCNAWEEKSPDSMGQKQAREFVNPEYPSWSLVFILDAPVKTAKTQKVAVNYYDPSETTAAKRFTRLFEIKTSLENWLEFRREVIEMAIAFIILSAKTGVQNYSLQD